MKLIRVIFWKDRERVTAYVMASSIEKGQSRVMLTYPGCTIHSVDEWPYDMVVV